MSYCKLWIILGLLNKFFKDFRLKITKSRLPPHTHSPTFFFEGGGLIQRFCLTIYSTYRNKFPTPWSELKFFEILALSFLKLLVNWIMCIILGGGYHLGSRTGQSIPFSLSLSLSLSWLYIILSHLSLLHFLAYCDDDDKNDRYKILTILVCLSYSFSLTSLSYNWFGRKKVPQL